ncbi:hypothetical protein CEXT_590101 [Caerostris extrusa]|uniref:Uncharacterized protein n=1 Tax=Caerostris extrusa TaxID=172846 RepID=A0AAV4TGH2_CAEEX|nr:hypothetical protein CEXT_590101 [Caerostris extrusa]
MPINKYIVKKKNQNRSHIEISKTSRSHKFPQKTSEILRGKAVSDNAQINLCFVVFTPKGLPLPTDELLPSIFFALLVPMASKGRSNQALISPLTRNLNYQRVPEVTSMIELMNTD